MGSDRVQIDFGFIECKIEIVLYSKTMSEGVNFEPGVWIVRICAPIAILIQLKLIKIELDKRKTENWSEHNNYEKWLKICSLSSMIGNVLILFAMITETIPIVCKYTFGFYSCLWSFSVCSLTLFQIVRLQYCFSSSQVHSDFGYPKCLFIILYAMRFILILYQMIVAWIAFSSTDIGNNFGCLIVPKLGYFWELRLPPIFVYYAWDLLTLMLYIAKLCQFSRKIKNEADSVYIRINFILKKMTVLVLTLTTFSWCCFVVYFLPLSTIQYAFRTLLHALAPLLDVIIVYLMIERNNKQYVMIVNKCCCKKLEDSEQQTRDVNNGNRMKKGIEFTINTETKAPIEDELNKYEDVSVASDDRVQPLTVQ